MQVANEYIIFHVALIKNILGTTAKKRFHISSNKCMGFFFKILFIYF